MLILPGRTNIENVTVSGGRAIRNCTFIGNSANEVGGGSCIDTLYNCTLIENSANSEGGGAFESDLFNSIVYYNTAPSGSNWSYGTLTYSCAAPLSGGAGNISSAPCFINMGGGNYRLATNSPCIDKGTNQAWMAGATDLDGRPRILYGRVDMGAYEAIPVGRDTDGDGIQDWWEFQYSGDLTNMLSSVDDDLDTSSNLGEYIAGTDPTDLNSVLEMRGMLQAGVQGETNRWFVLSWPSVASRVYAICWGTNLPDTLSVVTSGIPATPPMNVYTDSVQRVGTKGFYRVQTHLD